MLRRMAAAVSIALVLLFLGSYPAWGIDKLQPGPGPQPEYDGGGSDTDPDDFPLLAGTKPTAQAATFAWGDLSAKTLFRIIAIAAGVVPR